MFTLKSSLLALSALVVLAGCAGGSPTSSGEPTADSATLATQSQKITDIYDVVGAGGANWNGAFDYLVNVDGHVKGQAANVKGICMGSLISPRVVMTAKHCLDNLDQITVKQPLNKTGTLVTVTPTTSFSHASPRIDVGILLLPASPALSVRIPPVLATPTQFSYYVTNNTSKFVGMAGRINNGVVLNNDFVRSMGSGISFADWRATPAPGTVDEYLFLGGRPTENGDSGGPCTGENTTSTNVIIGINTFVLTYDWGGQSATCTRTDIIRSWLTQIISTNAFVASSSTFYTQFADYRNSANMGGTVIAAHDIWRLVQ